MGEIKRTFICGEEWLYYKIYCGSYSSDHILIESIKPIVNELLKRQLIDQWFFIRYKDPKNHLRLRFHLLNSNNLQEIIQLTTPYFCKLIENDIVYDITLATYKRELERYGKSTTAEAEKMFFYHSEKILELIENISPECDEIARIFTSLQMIDDLLEQFEVPLDNRPEFIKSLLLQFKEEFNIVKGNIKKIDQLYRNYKNDIIPFLIHKQEPPHLEGLLEIIKTEEKEIKTIKIILDKLKKEDSLTSHEFVKSIIHMNINRTFRSKQREYEMLCYDFMNRYYKSKIARK